MSCGHGFPSLVWVLINAVCTEPIMTGLWLWSAQVVSSIVNIV